MGAVTVRRCPFFLCCGRLGKGGTRVPRGCLRVDRCALSMLQFRGQRMLVYACLPSNDIQA